MGPWWQPPLPNLLVVFAQVPVAATSSANVAQIPVAWASGL